jgi:hypothetical protein
MRISDNRYSGDLRRYNLAWQMIRYEVRTGTIRAWTGLSNTRIRRLCQAYARGQEKSSLSRHRGTSPFQLQYFTRSSRIRREAALFGGICRSMRLLPSEPLSNAAAVLPSVQRGELLCLAYQAFREMTPETEISFERAVLLLVALAEAQVLRLTTCSACQSISLIDQLDVPRSNCSVCHSASLALSGTANAVPLGQSTGPPSRRERQRRLFD